MGAGSSTRFKSPVKKQWIYSGTQPLWLQLARRFEAMEYFHDIIIVSSPEEILYMQNFADFTFVEGGASRQASLTNALDHVKTEHVLVSDIARCCVDTETIERIMDQKGQFACIVPTLPAVDTMYEENTPVDRSAFKIVQTPQLSVTATLQRAMESTEVFTDESSAIAALGEAIHFVEGSPAAHKLTTLADLQKLDCLQAPSAKTRTGFGLDTHAFEAGKTMLLCGVKIDVEYGFKAHSDGDVAIHAVIDALLGAAGMGDIGELYPDTEERYAGADSKTLLKDTCRRITQYGFQIDNIDLTIVAQQPRLLAYKNRMRKTLAGILGIASNLVNIKATTSEKLGFIGRKEGVTVHALANLTYFNWKEL